MPRFERCDVCPVPDDVLCYAQRTGAAHAYCRKIQKGDMHARDLVLDHSLPQPKPAPTAPEAPPASAQAKPGGGCGCGKA